MMGWKRGLYLTTSVVGFAVACGGTVVSHGGSGGESGGGPSTIGSGDVYRPHGSGGVSYGSGGDPFAQGGSGNFAFGGLPAFGGAQPCCGPELGGYGGGGGANFGGAGGASPYTCVGTFGTDPMGTGTLGDACATTIYGSYGTCTAADTARAGELGPLLGHDSCALRYFCAHTPHEVDGGVSTWVTCSTNAGLGRALGGRCIPRGLAVVPSSELRIGQESCPEDFLCVPCYDPVDGHVTGACDATTPQAPPPSPLKTCGGFDGGSPGGYCVPEGGTITLGGASYFKQDECASGFLCVPMRTVARPGDCNERCTTTLGPLGDQYGPGACVPSYFVRDMSPAGLSILTAGTCTGPGDLCSPCLDPLNSGVPTGACQ